VNGHIAQRDSTAVEACRTEPFCASEFTVMQCYYSAPPIGKPCIAMSVCVCVCVCVCVRLSVRDHIFGTTRPIFTKFLCLLPMALARSFSGGVVICYVFPVFWMTSYLYISRGCSTSPSGLGSEAHMQPWAWRVGIPVVGSGRSGLIIAVRAY